MSRKITRAIENNRKATGFSIIIDMELNGNPPNPIKIDLESIQFHLSN